MQPMLNIAIRAARSAGDFIVRKINKLPDIQIETKALNDYVSVVDREAEARVIEAILKVYPQHSILGEESGVIKGTDEDYRWIIDPLDGTTNFLHSYPHYAVSIACEYRGKIEHGVIYDPIKQELFSASRGDGATVNNRRIRVARLNTTQEALLGTGFPSRHPEQLDDYLKVFGEFFSTASNIRCVGSAALDLAYVAAGRLDGYWQSGLNSWDIAAGALILREAGGLITDFRGDDNSLDNGEVIAANPKLLGDMLRKIQKSKPT
jgi:myo-inositol-1(or 4)-monophosphatase